MTKAWTLKTWGLGARRDGGAPVPRSLSEERPPSRIPWAAVLPLLAIPLFGGSPGGLLNLFLVMEILFLVLAVRQPVWAVGALVLSELTANNYGLYFGDLRVSMRLILTLSALLVVAPSLARQLDMGPRAMSMLAVGLAYLVWTIFTNAVAADADYVFQYFRFAALGVVVMALLPAVIRDREDLRILLWIGASVGLASAAVGILQHYSYTGMPVVQVVPNQIVPKDLVGWGGRALGLTENPIYLSSDMLILLMVFIGVAVTDQASRNTRWIAGLALLPLAAAMYVTYTRSAAYGAVVALVMMAMLYRGRFRREFWLALLVVIFLFWYWADLQGNRYSVGPTSDDSGASRPVLWTAGLNIALDNPYLGVGHNQFIQLSPEYAGTVDPAALERFNAGSALGRYEPHNDYLNVWLSFGTPGLLLYLTIIFLAVKNFLEAYTRASDPLLKGLALGLFGALVAFGVHSLFHNFLDGFLALWILAGLSLVLTKLSLAKESA